MKTCDMWTGDKRCEEEATRKTHGFDFCDEHYKIYIKHIAMGNAAIAKKRREDE
jgi:hypothetical protein